MAHLNPPTAPISALYSKENWNYHLPGLYVGSQSLDGSRVFGRDLQECEKLATAQQDE